MVIPLIVRAGAKVAKSLLKGSKKPVSKKAQWEDVSSKNIKVLDKKESKKLKKFLDKRDKEWTDLAKREEKFYNRKPGELNKLFPKGY
jgi:hypothetical protein